MFPRTVIPRDLTRSRSRVAERGRPEVVRWDPGTAAADGRAAARRPPRQAPPGPSSPGRRARAVKARVSEDFERGPLRYERLGPHHAQELEPLMLDPRVWRTLQDPKRAAADGAGRPAQHRAQARPLGDPRLRPVAAARSLRRPCRRPRRAAIHPGHRRARRSRSAGRCCPPGGVGGSPPSSP